MISLKLLYKHYVVIKSLNFLYNSTKECWLTDGHYVMMKSHNLLYNNTKQGRLTVGLN